MLADLNRGALVKEKGAGARFARGRVWRNDQKMFGPCYFIRSECHGISETTSVTLSPSAVKGGQGFVKSQVAKVAD